MEETLLLTKSVPLKHLVLAILSLASMKGQKKVAIIEFYQAFANLVDRFPDMFPCLIFTGAPNSRYSRRLDDALGSHIPYSIELDVQSNVSVKQETAIHFLGRFQEKYGREVTNSLTPVSEQFVIELNSKS